MPRYDRWSTPLKWNPLGLTEPPLKSNRSHVLPISKHLCHRLRNVPVCPPLSNSVVRYGLTAVNAAILVGIAFAFLDETVRWIVLGMAVLEVLITPQFLKHAQ